MTSSNLRSILALCGAALLASGAAACWRAAAAADEETFRGVYEVGRDRSAFLPCASDEQWYVWTGSTEARELRRLTNVQDLQPPAGGMQPAARAAGVRRAYVEVRGDTGAATPGRIAPGYERELRLTKVLVVQAAPGGRCP